MTHALDVKRPSVLVDVSGIKDEELKTAILTEMEEDGSFILDYNPLANFLTNLKQKRLDIGDKLLCRPIHGEYNFRQLLVAINGSLEKDNQFNHLSKMVNYGHIDLEATTDEEIVVDVEKMIELQPFFDLIRVLRAVNPEAEHSKCWVTDVPMTDTMLKTLSDQVIKVSDDESTEYSVKSVDEFLILCDSVIVPLI